MRSDAGTRKRHCDCRVEVFMRSKGFPGMVAVDLRTAITTNAVECKMGRRVCEIRQSQPHVFIAIVISNVM